MAWCCPWMVWKPFCTFHWDGSLQSYLVNISGLELIVGCRWRDHGQTGTDMDWPYQGCCYNLETLEASSNPVFGLSPDVSGIFKLFASEMNIICIINHLHGPAFTIWTQKEMSWLCQLYPSLSSLFLFSSFVFNQFHSYMDMIYSLLNIIFSNCVWDVFLFLLFLGFIKYLHFDANLMCFPSWMLLSAVVFDWHTCLLSVWLGWMFCWGTSSSKGKNPLTI